MRAVYGRRIAPGARVAAVAKEDLSLRGAFAVYGAAAGKFQFAGRPEWHIRRPRAGSADGRWVTGVGERKRRDCPLWKVPPMGSVASFRGNRHDVLGSDGGAEQPHRRGIGFGAFDPCHAAPLIVSLVETWAPILAMHAKSLIILAIPAGFEPATLCLEGRCSIQLSYGTSPSGRPDGKATSRPASIWTSFPVCEVNSRSTKASGGK